MKATLPIARFRWIAASALLLAVATGCATFRSYDKELTGTINLAASGNIDGAIKNLEAENRFGQKDLLYYLELGELQRLAQRYAESIKAWMSADERVQEWEKAAAYNPEKLLGGVGSVLLNDKSRPYEGHDYEKVMLTTRLALDRLAEGDFDTARVDIKRTHEREAIIADLRAKELQKTEDEARKKGVKTSFKELNGYPVESINSPEVNALKNSYESAFSHYLAGFVYEALGEPSLAAAGYRQAIELQPGRPVLEDSLANLDARVAAPADGLTDVLFVVETGTAPARKSRQFSLPFPYRRRLLIIPVSFPVMVPALPAFIPTQLQIRNGPTVSPVVITNVDLMARKALQEEMPGLILRGIIRSSGKAIAQYEAGKNDQTGLVSLALAIGSMVTETADERTWRSLPAQIAIARARIPPGAHVMSFGGHDIGFSVSGRYAVVGVRMLGNNTFAGFAPATIVRPEVIEVPR